MKRDKKAKSAGRLTLSKRARKELKRMFGNPAFYDELIVVAELHARKNKDYSLEGVGQGLYNFIWTAARCNTTPRMVFNVIRGIKDARSINLLRNKLAPLNESTLDTRRDDAVYDLLEVAFEHTYPDWLDAELTLLPARVENGEVFR